MARLPTIASLVLIAGLVTFAAVPASASATCVGETVRSALQTDASTSQSILCLVREERAAAGVGGVSENPKLEVAALGHSREMVAGSYFAHTSPTGVDFVERITDAGYTNGSRSWQVGENIAWGTGSMSTPASLVRAWMESPPHRANLLRGRFQEIGIGVIAGTPQTVSDPAGVTVASEYGYRPPRTVKTAKKANKNKKLKRGRATSGKRSALIG